MSEHSPEKMREERIRKYEEIKESLAQADIPLDKFEKLVNFLIDFANHPPFIFENRKFYEDLKETLEKVLKRPEFKELEEIRFYGYYNQRIINVLNRIEDRLKRIEEQSL